MLKVFIHYFPSQTLQQALFDALLLFVAVVFAVSLQVQGATTDWQLLVPSAFVFAVLMVLLNGVTGLYRLSGARSSAKDVVVAVAFAVLISIPSRCSSSTRFRGISAHPRRCRFPFSSCSA